MRVWSTVASVEDLKPGDLIRHRRIGDGHTFIVTANYGNRATAVRSVNVTQANEWQVFRAIPSRAEAEATT